MAATDTMCTVVSERQTTKPTVYRGAQWSIPFALRYKSSAHGSLEPPIGQGLICSQETKCIAMLYDASRFQKCIWEP